MTHCIGSWASRAYLCVNEECILMYRGSVGLDCDYTGTFP